MLFHLSFQVDTPDSVLQSGLGLTDLGQHAVLRSMVDPRDYDRLRHLQMNGGTPNTFEETIYKVTNYPRKHFNNISAGYNISL